MNKAFTKEDGVAEPEFVAPRPPLPTGVPNYVTPRGLSLLRAELLDLEAARSIAAHDNVTEQPSTRTALQARIQELEERLNSAELVDLAQPHDEVRFGARVTVQGDEKLPARQLEIVGVDEADAAHGRIAFVAPLARALLGKRTGDVVTLRTPRGEEELEILSVAYGAHDAAAAEAQDG